MKNNSETIFQIASGILILLGAIFKSIPIIITGLVPIIISVVVWYRNAVKNPIQELGQEQKELRKDLNMRKEIEEIKRKMEHLTYALKNKKGALDPATFLIILIILVVIVLILQEKGIF